MKSPFQYGTLVDKGEQYIFSNPVFELWFKEGVLLKDSKFTNFAT